MTKLKPCPFCGGNARLIKGWWQEEYHAEIRCDRCLANICGAGDDAEAIEQNIRDRWNRRAE